MTGQACGIAVALELPATDRGDWSLGGDAARERARHPFMKGSPHILRFSREAGGILKAFIQMSHKVSVDLLDKL